MEKLIIEYEVMPSIDSKAIMFKMAELAITVVNNVYLDNINNVTFRIEDLSSNQEKENYA